MKRFPSLFSLRGTAAVTGQKNMRATGLFESLEHRRLMSVSALNITSITSPADTDGGAGGAEHVSVVPGSTVTVQFSYTSTAANPTTAKFDVNTSPATVSTPDTGVGSGSAQTATLSLVIPAGTVAGQYNAHVQVRNGTGMGAVQNDSDASSVQVVVPIVITDVTPTLVVTAPNMFYNGSSYSLAGAAVTPTNAPGVVSFSYSKVNADASLTPLGSAPIDAGDYQVIAHIAAVPGSPINYLAASSAPANFTVFKVDAVINVVGYSGTYDAQAHGATGTATGVAGADLSAGLNLGASFTDFPGGTAHWTFTGGTNYNDASGSVAITIDKADAVINVAGYSGTYDAQAHGATGTATGVGGADLSAGLNLGASFTDFPGGTAHWTFIGGTNYNDASGSVDITIAKADATLSVLGYTGIYDAHAHGLTGSATGVIGENLSALLDLGASYTNAGVYTVNWSFAGSGNYNAASGSAIVNIAAKALSVSATTQSALNISKAGEISFSMSLSDPSQIIDGLSIAQLFNGTTVKIKVDGTTYEAAVTAQVVDNAIVFGIRMNAELQAALLTRLSQVGTLKSPTDVFSIEGQTNGGNYAFADTDVLTKLFQQGKLTF